MSGRRRRRGSRGWFRSFLRWVWHFRVVRVATAVLLTAAAIAAVEAVGLWFLVGARHPARFRVLLGALYGASIVVAVAIRRYRARRRRFRARTLAQLYALTPTQFEQMVADLLHDIGYRDPRRVGGAGDLAADILCRDADGRAVVVQCKRYAASHPVNSELMQQFIGMIYVHHKADYGIYVTTSHFTEPAAALAREHRILLMDGAALTRLMADLHDRDASRRQRRRLASGLRGLTGAFRSRD
jgi:HJR/Mrr/RecB family endonuclease